MKKKKALSMSLLCMFFLLLIAMYGVFSFRLRMTEYTSEYVQNGLDLAVIAGANIDLREYGSSGNLTIESYSDSLDNFKSSLKTNLNLEENNNPKYATAVKSDIKVVKYTVYNVNNGIVHIVDVNPETGAISDLGTKAVGEVRASDCDQEAVGHGYDMVVTKSTIYARVKFDVAVFMGSDVEVSKISCIDMTDE